MTKAGQTQKTMLPLALGAVVLTVSMAGAAYFTVQATPAPMEQAVQAVPANPVEQNAAITTHDGPPEAPPQDPANTPANAPGVVELPESNLGVHRSPKRDAVLQAIARRHGLAASTDAPADPDPDPDLQDQILSKLDKDYIREAIREDLVPVAVDCYDSALEDNPELAGKLTMQFTIIGAEEVGGIVEEASIVDDDSTLDDPFVRECMRESLLAVEFPAPENDGRVQVSYPFTFSPD